jgi:hypothetical protein
MGIYKNKKRGKEEKENIYKTRGKGGKVDKKKDTLS